MMHNGAMECQEHYTRQQIVCQIMWKLRVKVFCTRFNRYREQGPPKGAFGEEYPQNIQSSLTSQSVSAKRVRASPSHQDADRIDNDGLPHIGAAIWPGQAYYASLDRMTSKHRAVQMTGYPRSTYKGI